MSKGDLQFYHDSLIVETILGDNAVYKTAQSSWITSLLTGLKDEIVSHIDPNDKVGSVINLLAPGVITSLFGGKLGMFLGYLMSAFGIDATSVLKSVYEDVKNSLSHGETLTPAHIDNAVNGAIQQSVPPSSPTAQPADTHTTATLRDAKFLRLAFDDYEYQIFRLTKHAAPPMFDFFGGARKARHVSLLGAILKWIFKVVLMSAGLMVAGDMTRKVLGPSSSAPPAPPAPTTTQTKFPVNPSYQNSATPQPWEEHITNDQSSIENMLINFAKEVYSGLDGKEGAIQSAPNFQAVRDQITWFNHMASGEPVVYIPAMYANKKAIVDQFIDQVAKNAQ